MPIVPDFHGGVPQSHDTGSVAGSPVQAVTPTLDYESTMKKALQPIQDFAHSYTKVAEIEDARQLKAESDEAEGRIAQLISDRLYAPETGYLNQQGKNAMDGYKPTMEGLQKDVDNIIGNLSPRAREVVRSRANDRLAHADQTSKRWASVQGHSYQVNASKGRSEMLVSSVADNYADEDYVARTLASLDEEVEYLGKIQGQPPEMVAASKKAHRDALQAERFSAWGDDDPVGAFEAFGSVKDSMDAKVARDVEDNLWHRSKGLLAMQLAAMHPMTGGKEELFNAVTRGKTGIPLVDNLSPARKAELFTSVWQKQAEAVSASKGNLKEAVENSLATIAETGADPDLIGKEAFDAVYGETEGSKRHEAYQNDAVVQSLLHNFKHMSVEEMETFIKASAPRQGSADYADWQKRRNLMVKARDQIQKSRKADPVLYAIEEGEFGFAPLEFPSSPEQAVDQGALFSQISTRIQKMGDMAKSYGLTEQKVFSKDEVRQMERYLGAMSVDDRSAFIDRLTGTVDAGAVSVIRKQMGKFEMPFLLSADPEMNVEDASRLYMLGKSGFEEKQFKVTNITSSSGIGMKIEKINGLYQNEAVRERVIDAWKNVAGGLIVDGQESGYGRALEHALKIVVGDIHEYNGRKIALRGGASLSSVDETIRRLSDDYRKTPEKKVAMLPNGRSYTGAEFANELKTMPLTLADETNTFFMVKNNMIVRDMEGNPLVLSVSMY